MAALPVLYVHNCLRNIHEELGRDHRFGMPDGETQAAWQQRISQGLINEGLAFNIARHNVYIFRVNFDSCVAALGSKMQAMRPDSSVAQWVGDHYAIDSNDGKIRVEPSGSVKLHFAELMLLFVGRISELQLVNRGHKLVILCGDKRCAAPSHIAVVPPDNFDERKVCAGMFPLCFPCFIHSN